MPTCLACLCAHVLTCLACLRTHLPTCLVCLRAPMPTCFACLRAHVPTCLACLHAQWQRALRAYVLTRQLALRALRAYVPTCSRAVTTNNKNNFSTICFPYIFVIAFCFVLWLLLWNMHCSYQAEAFDGCYNKLCTIKWFDFCLSTSLRDIFNWLIKGKRWIIMQEQMDLAIAPYCLTRLLNQ